MNERIGRISIVGRHWVRTESHNEFVAFSEFVEILLLRVWRGVAEVEK